MADLSARLRKVEAVVLPKGFYRTHEEYVEALNAAAARGDETFDLGGKPYYVEMLLGMEETFVAAAAARRRE